MFLKSKSEFCLKNDFVLDRYVFPVIVLTRHADHRRSERSFKDAHLLECLEKGATKLGKRTKKHKCRPFKNTEPVLKDGKLTQATTVYALNKISSQRHAEVLVITVYYGKALRH